MRVTGGRLSGLQVRIPPGIIRPAMDRMRESAFARMDALGMLGGQSFADCFSGSGIIGIEAFSRGANPVCLVERDRGKKSVLLANLALSGMETAKLRLMPVETWVARDRGAWRTIWLDPPFPYAHRQDLINRLCRSSALSPRAGACILVHLPTRDPVAVPQGFRLDHDQRFGGSRLVWIVREQDSVRGGQEPEAVSPPR